MRKIIIVTLMLLVMSSPAFSDDLIDSSKLNMRQIDNLNMTGILPNYAANSSGSFNQSEALSYNLSRMKQMNPDFVTYPEAQGIIWLKHTAISRTDSGGMETERLYVILGRRGLGGKWLNWNIPVPSKGSVEVLEADIYDFQSLAKISSASREENINAGLNTVKFSGLPDTFILVLSWREFLPEQLTIEGLCWFQDELRVWESIVEVYSPQQLAYKTFPDPRSPEIENMNTETSYTWRRINIDPYLSSGELARTQRAGVVFSTKRGTSGITGTLKEAENVGSNIAAEAEALSGFKRSKNDGTLKLIEYLKGRPEIELAEGTPRRIPSSGALTRAEKLILAKSWLNSQKVEALLAWQLPFEPDDVTPLCSAMFSDPVLDVQGIKSVSFHDMLDPNLLAGAKIFSLNNEGRLISRRIPSSKSGENRLSAIMELNLNSHGMLSGNVRVLLRGGWGALMLGNNPTDGTARGALLSLFPGLTNYKDVKYRNVKGTPEISFTLENKPGVGGTGRGLLAIIPYFEPPAMRRLGAYDPPVELKFPFVVDQNITIMFPKNVSQALVTNKVDKNPDKINYSENYTNRRHRLIADSRFELNMNSVSMGNMSLLRRHLDQWRVFSSRHIPVR